MYFLQLIMGHQGCVCTFTSHLVAWPEDYSILEASNHAIKELLNAGKSKELLELLRNMDEGRAEAGATYS